MTDPKSTDLWRRIVEVFDEKLQYGFLDKVSSVVEVKVEGSEIHISVSSNEAFEFFRSEVNQQRLIILSRSIVSLDKVVVHRVDAEPLR